MPRLYQYSRWRANLPSSQFFFPFHLSLLFRSTDMLNRQNEIWMERWYEKRRICITHDTEREKGGWKKIPTMFYRCLISTILHHFHIDSNSNSSFLDMLHVAESTLATSETLNQRSEKVNLVLSLFVRDSPIRMAWFMHGNVKWQRCSIIVFQRSAELTVRSFSLIKFPLKFILILRDQIVEVWMWKIKCESQTDSDHNSKNDCFMMASKSSTEKSMKEANLMITYCKVHSLGVVSIQCLGDKL
jgi:hypothetical protein